MVDGNQRRLIVRLAQDERDLILAQRLRWRVFQEEMGAQITTTTDGLDADPYDALCDHLLVVDEERQGTDAVVGTYRLLRESVARKAGGFYSAGEFDLTPLITEHDTHAEPGAEQNGTDERRELLELGRSCVLAPYRTSATISLLWRGIADYITHHRIRLMFGCASFSGIDPDMFAHALSFLHHHHLAPLGQRPTVLAGKGVRMDRLAPGAYDERRALLQLPPLIKAYMRLGARFGEGAYIDHAFNTVDVCVVMPVELIANRYATRFRAAA